MIYPWQIDIKNRLFQAKKTGRLAHAYLFSGPSGMGKQAFVCDFSKSLLCQAPKAEGSACLTCQSCRLFDSKAHPDFYLIEPEESSRAIKIDQVRALASYSQQTAQYQGYKIILMVPADSMNVASSNALLKTLEEPEKNTLLFLIAQDPARLPRTVRSRCQEISFHTPKEAEWLGWLENEPSYQAAPINPQLLMNWSQGAPLEALRLLESKEYEKRQTWFSVFYQWTQKKIGLMECVKPLDKDAIPRFLFHLSSWVSDVLRSSSGGQRDQMINADLYDALKMVRPKGELMNAFQYWYELEQAKRWMTSSSNLNAVLLLESCLIEFRKVFLTGSLHSRG